MILVLLVGSKKSIEVGVTSPALIAILMILLKDISHKGTLVMNFPFDKLDPAKGALPADICRAAGWQDPREPIEIATPVRRATVECNQKKWAEYGKKLKRTVRAGMHEMLNNPNYKRAERQKYS